MAKPLILLPKETRGEILSSDLRPHLRSLRGRLEVIPYVGNPLEQVVQFYQVVMPWYDWIAEQSTLPEEMQSFITQVQRNKRSTDGVNRTTAHEVVTAEHIYLGGSYDNSIPVHSVHDWMTDTTLQCFLPLVEMAADVHRNSRLQPLLQALSTLLEYIARQEQEDHVMMR